MASNFTHWSPSDNRAKFLIKECLWILWPTFMEARYSIDIYDKIKEKRILFIHIPKTAGISLSEAIYGEQIGHAKWDVFYRCNPRNYASLTKFAVCRDPIERFISAFNFLKVGGINNSDRKFSSEVLERFDSADEFARSLSSDSMRARALNKVHFFPQTDFICNVDGIFMVDYILNLHNLQTDLPRILGERTPEYIPYKNAGPNSRLKTKQLTRKASEILEEIYALDFKLLRHTLELHHIFGTHILSNPRSGL